METLDIVGKARAEAWSDEQIVERMLDGETALYELIMRRYNQRIYRVVRSIVRDDGEAEDVMQDAYVRAYQHLDQFAGRAAFATWLTRIAVHEASARLRRRLRTDQLQPERDGEGEGPAVMLKSNDLNPEERTSRAEISQLIEQAMLELPEQYRTVLMLRDIEELSTSETAASLELSEENVKVRLHRGRALLKEILLERVGANFTEAFPFLAPRCDRIVQRVFARLEEISRNSG